MQNPDDALLPGMFVDAKVVLPPQPDMLVLPATAVEYTLYGDERLRDPREGQGRDESRIEGCPHPGKTGAR